MIQKNVNSTFSFIQLPPSQTSATVSEFTKVTTQQIVTEVTSYSTLVSTTSTCVNITTPAGRAPTIGWAFEGNLNDRFLIYNGTGQNNITYGVGRNGCGKCLNLNSSLSQSVYIYQTPHIELRGTSFSIEAWIKPTVVTDGLEHVILAQCASSNSYQCMRASIGNPGPMTFRFRADTETGSQNILINAWSHLAYVYNSTAGTIALYLNGTLDKSGNGHGPYQGMPTFFQIGGIESIGGLYYSGCIDELLFYRFARTASEISDTFALG